MLLCIQILARILIREGKGESRSFARQKGFRVLLDTVKLPSNVKRYHVVKQFSIWLLREAILAETRNSSERRKQKQGSGISWLMRLMQELWPTATLDNLLPGTENDFDEDEEDEELESGSDFEDNENERSRERQSVQASSATSFSSTSSSLSSSSLQAPSKPIRMTVLETVKMLFSRGHSGKQVVIGAKELVPVVLCESVETEHGNKAARVAIGTSARGPVCKKLKEQFVKVGGVDLLFGLLRRSFSSKGFRLSPGQDLQIARGPRWRKRAMEARYALGVLHSVVEECEAVKEHVGESVGYIGFAKLLERSSIPLDRDVFSFIFELGTCGEGFESKQQNDSEHVNSMDVEAIVSRELASTLLRVLRAKCLFAKPPKCSRKFVVIPFESTHDDESSSTGSASRQSMDMGGKTAAGVRKEGTVHLRTPSWSSLSLADMGASGGAKSSTSLSSSSLSTLSSLLHSEKSSADGKEGSWNGAFLHRQTSQERTESLFGLQTTRKFRSTEAALMAILLLPHATPSVQIAVIRSFGALLDANPSNVRYTVCICLVCVRRKRPN